MVKFPSEYVDQVTVLEPGIGEKGDAALRRIHEKGYTIALGLTEYYADAVRIMGHQRHIREYCPKDATESRFGSLASTANWLQKSGGRGMFLLLKGIDRGAQLEGYSWTGVEMCEELPEHTITSAYRVGERVATKHLGKDFIQVVVSGTHTLYAPEEGIGLETWESNRAVNLYTKLGFILIAGAPEQELRPTLDPLAENGQVLDRRLYMGYPSELLVS
jgi:hypothetical protein